MATPMTPAQCVAEIDRIIANIKRGMAKPAFVDETSQQLKQRADRRRNTAESIMVGNKYRPKRERIKVRYEYRPIKRESNR